MKNQICIVLLLAAVIALASEGVVKAQSAGGASKVESPVAPLVNSRVEMLRETSNEVKRRIGNLQQARKNRLAEFREKSLSDISFEEVFRLLHVQKVELEIELEGLGARSKMLKERLRSPNHAAAESKAKLSEDAAKLQMKLAQQRLATKLQLHKKGAVSKAEVDAAEHEVAVAKLQLVASAQKLANPSPELLKAIFEVSLEIAEKTAKRSTVEAMLKKYIESRDDFIELNEFNAAIEDSMDWLMQLSREMASPELTDAKF